jgi:hypothetical protein
METRCLTVCAPFAHLIATGAKTIENRPRRTHYRGRLLIHAGVRRTYGGHSADYWATLFGVEPSRLVYGAIVGAVDLIDCVPIGSPVLAVPPSPHAIGPWCWILANARRLAVPVPLSGKLGLFKLDAFTLARVGEALARPFNFAEVSL